MADLQRFLTSPFFVREQRPMPSGGWGEDWGRDHRRAPDVGDDRVIIDLPGRVIGKVCHRSHYFRVGVSGLIYVSHGAGQERFSFSYEMADLLTLLERATDDEQYLMIRRLFELRRKAREEAGSAVASKYDQAFVDGRITKKKTRGQDLWRVTLTDERGRVSTSSVRATAVSP